MLTLTNYLVSIFNPSIVISANISSVEEEGLLSADTASLKPRKEKKALVGMLEAVRHPDHRKAVFAVIMIMIAQQLTGINSIIMYGVHLLADLLQSNSAMLNLAVSALNIAVTAGCAPLVDKLGRKSCLIGSIGGMGISSVLLAIGIQNSYSVLSAIAVLFFVGSFGFGLGPIPFILASELAGQEAVNATSSEQESSTSSSLVLQHSSQRLF
jgi:Na+/melibiose symporter-like transporter